MKPRKCPHCGFILPIQCGYTFDKDLNVLCEKCHKIVFPAIELQKSDKDCEDEA